MLVRLAVVLIALLPLQVFAGDFDGVGVFGMTSHAPFAPVPDAPYALHGHHFSNGATWAERLSKELEVRKSGKAALRAPGVFTNYAVGRARARAGAPTFPQFDLGTQVGRFLSDFGGQASSGNLYIVEIGANDLQDALTALAADPSGASAATILEEALTAVATNVYTLWASGARTFLVVDAPDLAITPVVRSLGPEAQFAAAYLSGAYNAGLAHVLNGLQTLPGIQIVRLDLNAIFAAIVATPQAFGVRNVDEPCLTFGVVAHAVCAHPDRYLFWDGIHPTARGHEIIATAALEAIGEE
jgi:outer membrane lipase/esterase